MALFMFAQLVWKWYNVFENIKIYNKNKGIMSNNFDRTP